MAMTQRKAKPRLLVHGDSPHFARDAFQKQLEEDKFVQSMSQNSTTGEPTRLAGREGRTSLRGKRLGTTAIVGLRILASKAHITLRKPMFIET